MDDSDAAAALLAASPVTLDPFAFWPKSASKIAGLGGPEIDADPAYVFHTLYSELAPDYAECRVQFSDMTAEYGSLVVRINALPPEPDASAAPITWQTIELRDLAASGNAVILPFDTKPGTSYAALGHMYGHTDARASALEVTMTKIERPVVSEDQKQAARKSSFGRRMFRKAPRMIGRGQPTLADPVSQDCTDAQFDETVYHEWLNRLHMPMHRHPKQWEMIYILQTLDRYSMLKPGARGIGFGVGLEPLPAAMASLGCTIVATDLDKEDERASRWRLSDEHAATIDQLRQPGICPNDVFDQNVTLRAVDMNAIDEDLREFDFTWSCSALEHLGSAEDGLAFIRNSVSCLKFGGLAVHTFDANLSLTNKSIGSPETVSVPRRDIARIALDLVSRGHYVAQLKYSDDEQLVTAHDEAQFDHTLGERMSAYGLIIRRGER